MSKRAVGDGFRGATIRPMPFACRSATPADAEALVALVNDAFEVEADMLTGERIALPEVMDRLERGAFLVCDAEGSLAGCVYLELRGRTGYLGLVSVATARQSLGLGRDLMAAGEDWLREAGCGVCQLWVLSSRPELLAWYGRRGYRIVRREPFEAVDPPPTRRPLRPIHFQVMERSLTTA